MIESFQDIDKWRVAEGPMGSTPEDGRHGAFIIPLAGYRQETVLIVIATDGTEMPENPETRWEHVSVHAAYQTGKKGEVVRRIPTWTEMALIKNTFWGPEEVVMQLHPRESQYVNSNPTVLHLWRPLDPNGTIPEPPAFLVGILGGAYGKPGEEPDEGPAPEAQRNLEMEPDNVVQIRRVPPGEGDSNAE